MTCYEMYFVHTLDKVLPDRRPEILCNPYLEGFSGETLSLQLAYTCSNDDFGGSSTLFSVEVDSRIADSVRIRKVELVPCNYPCHGTWDDDYLVTRPGLYPDLLLPVARGESVKAIAGQWRSLWIDVDAMPGTHTVTLTVHDAQNREITALSFTVHVLDVSLPKQRLIHTQWFHTDCLADSYNVPVFYQKRRRAWHQHHSDPDFHTAPGYRHRRRTDNGPACKDLPERRRIPVRFFLAGAMDQPVRFLRDRIPGNGPPVYPVGCDLCAKNSGQC